MKPKIKTKRATSRGPLTAVMEEPITLLDKPLRGSAELQLVDDETLLAANGEDHTPEARPDTPFRRGESALTWLPMTVLPDGYVKMVKGELQGMRQELIDEHGNSPEALMLTDGPNPRRRVATEPARR